MRGKVRETSAPAGYVRIPPAYAGKRPHYAPLYSVMQFYLLTPELVHEFLKEVQHDELF